MTTSLTPIAPSEWQTITLSADESARLAEAADRSTHSPRMNPAGFREEAKNGWAALSYCTRTKIERFAQGRSPRPEVYITNLPIDPALPPTPVVGQTTDVVTNPLGEFLMVTFSLALGFPISFRDQRAGRLVHDVYPTSKNAGQVSSQSSSVSLGFHTEMFFHPSAPDFLILHCLRADPDGIASTSIASLDDIKSRLTPHELAVLSMPRFAMDLANLHGSYRHEGRRIRQDDLRPVFPIIDEHAAGVQFRFEPELTTALGEEAHSAMLAADAAAEAVAVAGKLEGGAMLLLDNRRAVHSRSPFKANFDGRDRWLRRMMVGAPLQLPLDVDPGEGFYDRPDLELLRAWDLAGASLHAVPYASGSHEAQADAFVNAKPNQHEGVTHERAMAN